MAAVASPSPRTRPREEAITRAEPQAEVAEVAQAAKAELAGALTNNLKKRGHTGRRRYKL